MDLIDRTKYRKDLLAAYDDVSMEFDVLDSQPTIKAVPLDKVKQAKEEIYEASRADADGMKTVIDLEKAFEILYELIAESEENNEDNG